MLRIVVQHRLAIAAFVVATAYLPGLFSSSFMPRWWAMTILLPLVSSIDPRALSRPIGVCLLAGLTWAAVTLFWAPVPAEGAMDLFFMVLLSLALLAGACADDLDDAVIGFGAGIAISVTIVMAYHLGHPINVQNSGLGGLFLNTEVMAEVAAPVLVWALWKRQWWLAVPMAVPLALCDSRISIIAVMAGLLFGWHPRRVWVKWTLAGVLVICAISSVIALGLFKTSTGFSRFILWGAALEALVPFGRGLGWWAVGHPGPMEEYTHSDALQLCVELGLGALPLLAVPIIVLWKGAGNVAERSAFSCLLVEATVSFPSHMPAAGFLAALLAGRMARRGYNVCNPQLERGASAIQHFRRALSPGRAVV